MTLALVTVAGAIGAALRFIMEYLVRRHHPTRRPWATVAANVLGAFVAGWIVYRLSASSDAHIHAILLTGFCGGLTTFSSAFAVPALLQREHHWGYAAAVVVAAPVLSGLAFALGMSITLH